MNKFKIKNNKKVLEYRRDPDVFFRVGLRYAEKHKFDDAKRFLEKAVNSDPYNADYQFNLACILSELKDTRKSNRILIGIIREIDPTIAECYFGIACNYFEMGNLKKAMHYLEKYVSIDKDGEFIAEAYDILYYLQIYDVSEPNKNMSKKYDALLAEAKKLLSEGLFRSACQKLEKIIELEPQLIGPRNDLALACFFYGRFDKAVSLAASATKLNHNNLMSNCLLALFYASVGYIESFSTQIDVISNLKVENRDEFFYEHERFADIILPDVKFDKDLRKIIIETINKKKEEIEKVISDEKYDLDLMNSKKAVPIWRDKWEEVIICAENRKESSYKPSYTSDLKKIWISFINRLSPEEIPHIGKVEVWAAVLEYIYCSKNLIRVTKKGISVKYNISPSSISSKLKYFGM